MKKIGLDVRMIQSTGIGTYLRGILDGFDQNRADRLFKLQLYGNPNQTAGRYVAQPFQSKIYTLNEQFSYGKFLKQCDLWHSPHYNIPYLKGKTKLVVTVHDLIHWIFRKDFFSPAQAFYAGTFFRRVAKRADHIIAVSESTKQDLIKHFHAKPERISVIYEGVEKKYTQFASFEELSQTLNKHHLPHQYFLYVGSLKPHKNVLTLLEVFKTLRQKKAIHSDLVIVGKKDAKYPPGFDALENLETGNGIHHLTKFEDLELVHLYQGAMALVHPSFYEGFGLTLLEAMACGTPVISSNAASLPEVAGDAAILFDPKNPNELAEALRQIEKDESLRRKLREKGFKQLQKFSWSIAAKKTLEVYDKVLSR